MYWTDKFECKKENRTIMLEETEWLQEFYL